MCRKYFLMREAGEDFRDLRARKSFVVGWIDGSGLGGGVAFVKKGWRIGTHAVWDPKNISSTTSTYIETKNLEVALGVQFRNFKIQGTCDSDDALIFILTDSASLALALTK